MKNFLSNLNLTLKYFHTPREILFLFSLFIIALISLTTLAFSLTNYFKVDRIVYRGSMSEGIVGTPKITNPFTGINQAEKNLSTLLFSSLIKNINGDKFDLGLAEKIENTSDKKEYKIYINKNAKFSDGRNIIADDVIYSLQNIPAEKDFLAEKINDTIISVKFKKEGNLGVFSYPVVAKDSNFEENYSSNLLTSSAFRIKAVSKDLEGNVTKISLIRFDNGENKLPYLENYNLYFYTDETQGLNDFQTKELQLLSGISGQTISKIKDDTSLKIITSKLSNNFALFLNQNQNESLQDADLRKILSETIDREALVNQVLGGYAVALKNILGENPKKSPTGLKLENGVLYNQKSPVKISITTINNKELVDTAKFIANSWKKLGIETTIIQIERSQLQAVVKDRDFDILLFGFSVKNVSDYSSFFHSRERTYPKLNIANYTRKKVDEILENLQDEKNIERQKSFIKELSAELSNDLPVILLYKPVFVQAVSANVNVQMPETLNNETDKYQSIENWYIYTEKVLNIFENLPVLKNSSIFLDKILN